jgi:hypothetical protein
MNLRFWSHRVGKFVDWLWWGETDISEMRPLWACCAPLGDLRCGPWMMILTGTNFHLLYQSVLAAPGTVRRFCQQRYLCCSPQYWLVSCQQRHLWQSPVLSGFLPSETSLERVGGGQRNWEFSLSIPWDLKRSFTCRKILQPKSKWSHGIGSDESVWWMPYVPEGATGPIYIYKILRTTWDLWLYFPSKGMCAVGFYYPYKSIALAVLQPATFVSSASTLTTTPPRRLSHSQSVSLVPGTTTDCLEYSQLRTGSNWRLLIHTQWWRWVTIIGSITL